MVGENVQAIGLRRQQSKCFMFTRIMYNITAVRDSQGVGEIRLSESVPMYVPAQTVVDKYK